MTRAEQLDWVNSIGVTDRPGDCVYLYSNRINGLGRPVKALDVGEMIWLLAELLEQEVVHEEVETILRPPQPDESASS